MCRNFYFLLQQLSDPFDGGFSPGGHVDQFGHGHNGPDDGVEVADKLHKLAGVEAVCVDQIAAIAQDDADHTLHKQHDQHTEGDGGASEGNVGVLVVSVELPEVPQLFGLLDEGLDHRNAGEALLREVGQAGEGCLPGIPLFGKLLAHQNGGGQQQRHGNQGEQGEQMIHPPHFDDGEAA